MFLRALCAYLLLITSTFAAWNPIANTVPQYEISTGVPASGYVLKFYAAGTTTNISVATDSTGGTTVADVDLNSNGYPEVSGSIIIPHVDQDYKISLFPTQAAADSNTGAVWTIDNIETTAAASNEWQASNITPTRTGDTTFTMSGDQTAEFHVNRRLRLTDSGGTDYATITATSFSDPTTTVTVAVDAGGALDAGLSAVDLSILSGDNSAVPSLYLTRAENSSIGTNTATLTVTPSVRAYVQGLTITFKAGGTNTGATTINVNSAGAKSIKRPDGAELSAGDITSGQMYTITYDGTDFILVAGLVPDGTVLQVVNTQTGAVSTGTTTMPNDDTIPQNTEGDEYMTLAITPNATSNILKIQIVIHIAHTAVLPVSAALFQDSTAGALAASSLVSDNANQMYHLSFTHWMTAGTTSATTFKVRAGGNGAGTTTFNGASGARRYGGVLASSITITEIKSD